MKTNISLNEKRMKNTKEKKQANDDRIIIGSRVSLINLNTGEHVDVNIVASVQNEMQHDNVSSWSPLGKELIGRKCGERISVKVPKGIMSYEISKVA